MWMFLPFGLLSVVAHRRLADTLLVRARRREHLVELVQALGGGPEIQSSPYADYPFRVEVKRVAFASFVSKQLLEMSYDNFKNEASRVAGDRVAGTYADSLHDVWATMREIEAPRSLGEAPLGGALRTRTPRKRAPRATRVPQA